MIQQQADTTEMTMPSDKELLFTRTFNAPRTLVWKACSQAEHLTQWWSPDGWTMPICQLDFKQGGKWFYAMQGPDGEMAYAEAIYHEIVEPERIVYVDYFTDEHRNPVADLPQTHVTITLTENAGKTTMSYLLRSNKTEDRDILLEMGMEQGFRESLARLDTLLTTLS